MASNFEILSLILSIAFLFVGMIYQDQKIKHSNIREKATYIDEKTIPILNQHITDLIGDLDNKTYIKFRNLQEVPILKLSPNYFFDILKPFNIFKIQDEKVVLTYTKDKDLNKHMTIILKCLNEYHNSSSKLEKLIESLVKTQPSKSFIQNLREISISEFGENKVNSLNPKNADIFALHFLSITGSQNAYKSGHVFVIELLKKRFDDLQVIVSNDSEYKDTYYEIQQENKNIKDSLTCAFDEIQKLHEKWQNKLII